MALLISEATIADAQDVGRLIDAMDTHYRGAGNTGGVDAAAAMAARCIAVMEGTRFLVASKDGEPVGLVCFAIIRPGRRHAGLLFLKDLFVPAHARGHGVGRALMAELARYAIDRNIGRIDLNTDAANARAQRLYEAIGARRQDKVAYTIEVDALTDLAVSAPPLSSS